MDNIAELAAALVAAQAELTNPQKAKTANVKHRDGGGSHSYTYATLADTCDAVRAVFTKYGLCIIHTPAKNELGACFIARLIHKSGQYMDFAYPMPDAAMGAQDLGSWMTYMRRYSIFNIAFIAGEDDDGAAAQEAHETQLAALAERKTAEAREKLIQAKAEAAAKKAEANKATTTPAKAADPEAKKEEPPTDQNAELIDKRIKRLLIDSGINEDELKAYYVKAGHKPDSVEVCDLDDDYIGLMIENWSKVEAKIKGARK